MSQYIIWFKAFCSGNCCLPAHKEANQKYLETVENQDIPLQFNDWLVYQKLQQPHVLYWDTDILDILDIFVK